MGASISGLGTPSAEEKKQDDEVLQLAALNLFSEAYCRKLVSSLPKEEEHADDKHDEGHEPVEAKLSRLMILFSKEKGDVAVDDFHCLSSADAVSLVSCVCVCVCVCEVLFMMKVID